MKFDGKFFSNKIIVTQISELRGFFSRLNVRGARTGLASRLDNTSAKQAKFRPGHKVSSEWLSVLLALYCFNLYAGRNAKSPEAHRW